MSDRRVAADNRQDWETPPQLMRAIECKFNGSFTLDGAASVENAKAPRFYTEEMNAFLQDPREEYIWCNPPYKTLAPWIELFARWAQHNTLLVLLPAATDTEWFGRLVDTASEIYLLEGRVQFVGTTSSNPSGSIVAWYELGDFPAPARIEHWRWKRP